MGMQICRLAFRKHLEKYTGLCYNTPKPATTNPLYSPRHFITADKILISIHRTAIIIWVIKIIRTAGATSYKQNCLRCKSLQRVGIMNMCRYPNEPPASGYNRYRITHNTNQASNRKVRGFLYMKNG